MTKEILEKANDLQHDIEVLEILAQRNQWTAFQNTDNEDKVMYIQSVTFLNDFKAFVDAEKTKLSAELEQI
jgi:hypothetical protein